ncbi:MAG: phosphatase PAP2 family protein [Ferruginibacter sp.]|nr:phosphatase PAP2 family protein [Ferruginibacter sp.]
MDIDVVKSLNTNQSSYKTNYCSFHANSVTYINLGAPLTVLTIGIIKKDKKMQQNAAYMVGSFLLSSAISNTLKNICKQKRPYEMYPEITKLSSGGGYSFPSGHTSAAFSTAASLCFYYPKWYIITPACLWATSVAVARMYQGVHYPKDIVTGAVVGVGSAWATYKFQKWMNKKHK